MPTSIGGEKLKISFRTGPVMRGIPAARAFPGMKTVAIAAARTASTSHVHTQPTSPSREATMAAMMAVQPMTTSPQPETAVNVPARSIVSRMKRRLSIARSCISGGVDCGGRRGITGAMAIIVGVRCGGSKYFEMQSQDLLASFPEGLCAHSGRRIERTCADPAATLDVAVLWLRLGLLLLLQLTKRRIHAPAGNHWLIVRV